MTGNYYHTTITPPQLKLDNVCLINQLYRKFENKNHQTIYLAMLDYVTARAAMLERLPRTMSYIKEGDTPLLH